MTREDAAMKCEKCGHDHAANEICVKAPNANDNHFDEKKWRKDYMREYMRKKRERLREAKLAKGEAS
jgi:hypothetical protein